MILEELLQNISLPIVPTVCRLAFIGAVLFGLYCIRNEEKEEQENLLCFSILTLWSVWHGAVAVAVVLCRFIAKEPIQYNWFRDIYHTSYFVLGGLTVLLAALCAIPYLWRTRKKETYFILFGGLLAWSCVCTPRAGNLAEQWVGTDYSLDGLQSYFIFGAVLLCACRLQKRKKLLLCFFALAANTQAILILFQKFNAPWALELMIYPCAGTFFNSNHCGYYLTVSILCSLGLFLYDRGNIRRIAYLLSFGLQYYALLLNDSLGCYLAVWAGVVAAYVLFVLCRKAKLADYVPVALLFTVSGVCFSVIRNDFCSLFSGIDNILEDSTSKEADAAGSGRFAIWRKTVELIAQKPLFGWGPEGIDDVMLEAGLDGRPHNEYLQYAAYLGIPGLLLYLGGLVTLCVDRLKRLKDLDVTILIAGGAVFGYLISAFFGNTKFQTSPLFFLLLGLVASETADVKEDETICAVDSPI